jgi:hypothetical protein
MFSNLTFLLPLLVDSTFDYAETHSTSILYDKALPEDDDFLERDSFQQRQDTYQESMQEIWQRCEEMMDQLAKEKQAQIERLVEEVTQEKWEKIAEIKGSFDFMIKRLETAKQKDKAEAKKREKDEEVRATQE